MKEIYNKIQQLAEPYLDTRYNDIHTRIATECAFRLLEREGGDEEIVIPAILLHDVGWKSVPEELQHKAFGPKATMPEMNRVHEVEGVRIAREILEKVGYDRDRVEEILMIIDGHDSRVEPLSLNDRIVKDADKLWRFSREAFHRDSRMFGHTHEQHMERLRTKLKEWFLTDSAREFAMEEMEERAKDCNA